jgi:hypothetical protein
MKVHSRCAYLSDKPIADARLLSGSMFIFVRLSDSHCIEQGLVLTKVNRVLFLQAYLSPPALSFGNPKHTFNDLPFEHLCLFSPCVRHVQYLTLAVCLSKV